MMGKTICFSAFMLFMSTLSMAQKSLSEGSIHFDITVQTGTASPDMADMFDGANASLYIRGPLSRSELSSALGKTVTIYDYKSGTGVVLREFGPQKLLIRMNRDNWADKNQKYEGIRFVANGLTKIIAGYSCEGAVALLSDSSSFTVFFTRQLVVENNQYDPQFAGLEGTALEYESMSGGMKVKYSANKVSFDPIPMQKFDIPKSGYRQMSYEESTRKGGK
jgi:hypothetical protein